jgi:hypothetical protein
MRVSGTASNFILRITLAPLLISRIVMQSVINKIKLCRVIMLESENFFECSAGT